MGRPLCRVKTCVRFDHLEPVTPKINYLRGTSPMAANARKTHCLNGHLFDEANTYVSKRGFRMCRACTRDRMRVRRANARAMQGVS